MAMARAQLTSSTVSTSHSQSTHYVIIGRLTLDAHSKDDLNDVKKKVRDSLVQNSPEEIILDYSLPVIWASKNKEKFDAILFVTGSHTYCDKDRLYSTLATYRSNMKLRSKFMAVAFACNKSSLTIAKPDDARMYDIAGFDCNVPQLIISFINEEF